MNTNTELQAKLRDAIEAAWGIIANASGGNWNLQRDDWIEAAVRWRDKWLPELDTYDPSNLTRPTPDPTEILRKVREILVESADCDQDAVRLEATFAQLKLDSLDGVELIMQIEDTWEIDIDDATAENWKTVGDVVKTVQELTRPKES